MDLGSSDRLAMVSEKCIHSVAWPNLSRDPCVDPIKILHALSRDLGSRLLVPVRKLVRLPTSLGHFRMILKSHKPQAPSPKLDNCSQIIYDKDIMKNIKKKLIKQVKRSRPSLAQEIKDMPMKDFRALWFVVQQGLKIKKKN